MVLVPNAISRTASTVFLGQHASLATLLLITSWKANSVLPAAFLNALTVSTRLTASSATPLPITS